MDYVKNVALVMRPRLLCRQEVARHGVMSGRNESVTNYTRVFTSD
jgi:hypothetical protein